MLVLPLSTGAGVCMGRSAGWTRSISGARLWHLVLWVGRAWAVAVAGGGPTQLSFFRHQSGAIGMICGPMTMKERVVRRRRCRRRLGKYAD